MKTQDVMQPPTDHLDYLLTQLDDLIGDMETGQLSIEESLTSFAKSIELVKKCQHVLNKTEQNINILSNDFELENEE